MNYATFFIIPVYIIASNKNSAIFYERRLRRVINEIKLLHNLKNKKRNCLEDVIKLYTPYVSVVIYNTIGSIAPKEDIEEAISDTFLQLWKNADSIDEEKGCIRSYIGAVARNTAKNKLRTIRVNEELDENIVSDSDNPQDILLKNEDRKFLLDMIAALGEPDSEIFLRYYYYNEKIRTISDVMNINVSTVKSKLSRGKEKLKNAIMQNGRFYNE